MSRSDRSSTPTALGPRLEALCALVPPGSRVADIGADHGKVATALLERGRATACIATERHGDRIARLRDAVHHGTAPPGLSVRVGDGLAPLRPGDRVDVVLIAGMGGHTIVAILNRGLARIRPGRLVLQPQTEHGRVRRWLRDRSWSLVDERTVRDGDHVYVALGARPGTTTDWDPPEGLERDDVLEAGPLLLRSRDGIALEWWGDRLRRLRVVVSKLPSGRGRRTRSDLERAERIVRALRSDDGSGPLV